MSIIPHENTNPRQWRPRTRNHNWRARRGGRCRQCTAEPPRPLGTPPREGNLGAVFLKKGNTMLNHTFTGNIKSDVRSLLYISDKAKTFDHSQQVAKMNAKIAKQYGLDQDICEISGYLHDISAVISPSHMMEYAIQNNWEIDEAEHKYPMLLHQRISQVIAKEDFGVTDPRILSAVGHHTTLKANPSAYDMALFVADKLAWDQDGTPPFYTNVSNALEQSLELASLVYMRYMMENNMILHPHRWWKDGLAWFEKNMVMKND